MKKRTWCTLLTALILLLCCGALCSTAGAAGTTGNTVTLKLDGSAETQ